MTATAAAVSHHLTQLRVDLQHLMAHVAADADQKNGRQEAGDQQGSHRQAPSDNLAVDNDWRALAARPITVSRWALHHRCARVSPLPLDALYTV